MARRLGLSWLGLGMGWLGSWLRLGLGRRLVGAVVLGMESLLGLAVVLLQRLGTVVVWQLRIRRRLSVLMRSAV